MPRRRDLVGLAACAAAVLIAVELGVTYWFYLYIPWFFGACRGRAARARARSAGAARRGGRASGAAQRRLALVRLAGSAR